MSQGQIIEGRIMPGGWHYFQGNDKITGYSLEDLLENVRDHRLANGIDVGNVYADVEAQVCQKYPAQCRGSRGKIVSDPKAKKIHLTDRIARWASKIGNKNAPKVDRGTAEARARICMACPSNVDWQSSGCNKCTKNARQLSAILRGAMEVGDAERLMACSVHGHDNRTAVWIGREAWLKTDRHVPENCWMK